MEERRMFREEEEKKDPDPPVADPSAEKGLGSSFTLSPAWSELEALAASQAAQAQGGGSAKDDTDLLRRYIRICPFVDANTSPAVAAALEGLERPKQQRQQKQYVAAVTGTETEGVSSPTATTQEDESRPESAVETETDSKAAPAPALNKAGSPSTTKKWATMVAVLIFLDLPLLYLFVVHYGFHWTQYVHDNYLHDQISAMVFSDERSQAEATYFTRKCDVTDLSTQSGEDLFLSPSATADEAYEHNLKHGFTVFPGVLKEETIAPLREFVVGRNRKLSAEESIYVIEGDNRYSFGLGTEEPAVVDAVMEIANHPQLRPALEKILGPNPALIEMTAITSSYGAVDQYYHDDVIPEGSAIRYSRTFGPSYSVFIQLQNTTKEMGATGACPGTLYCNDGPIDELCEEEGFQVVGDDGYWRAGDALLMNMNSFHRGSAHTDPDGEDRVMLILTFSPKPNPRAESRQMSQGITFSLRWDMWGHTLDDLARADQMMVQPWATLRSLGLYKLPGAPDWGVDFITGSSQRLANGDYGYKVDELDDYIEDGGLPWLPEFLQGVKAEESDSWHEYLQDAWFKCFDFAEKVYWAALGTYGVILFPLGMMKNQRMAVRRVLVRMGLYWAVVFYLFNLAKRHVDQTTWAADIKAERRFVNVFDNQSAFGIDQPGPTTLPHRRDVLIETRFGSEYLHLYEDYINGHPGNRVFLDLVKEGAKTYASYPEFLKDASARYIVSAVDFNQGRFLYQGSTGRWHWIGDERAEDYTKRQLAAHSNAFVGMVSKNIRRLQSNYMYGVHRSTIMAQKYSVPYLRALDDKILGLSDPSQTEEQTTSTEPNNTFKPLSYLPDLPLRADGVRYQRISSLPPASDAEEPKPGAWIMAGEQIEFLSGDFWYVARVHWIDALGNALVMYFNGEAEQTTMDYIRKLDDYQVDEEVEVEGGDDYYYACTVESFNDDGTINVYGEDFDGDGMVKVTKHDLRRPAEEGDGEVAERKAAY